MRTILSVLFFLIASQSSANVTKKDFDEWRPAEQLAFLAGMGQGFQAVNEALEATEQQKLYCLPASNSDLVTTNIRMNYLRDLFWDQIDETEELHIFFLVGLREAFPCK